ncbi:hypothetical protein K438DRAFT_1820139 [Mycena galopus ATCC 62051]|nr:hypothetical protein K438DRAFT_1820139 [Mycena galopus ATCC 62051]
MYAEDSLILMICLRVMDEPRKNYVEMITLDVQTGTPNQLCIARAPDSDYDNPFRSPVISGALAVVCTGTYSGSTTHIFIDWRAGLYFILRGRADSPLHIALIQQHILLMTPSLDEEDQIHIISNQVLHSYWAPIVGVHDPGEFAVVLAEDVPKLSTFEDPDADQSFYDMHVHESPLRRGEYRLWIGTNDSRGGLFCSQLSISMDGEPQWRVRSRASETKWFYPGTSYSGHSLLHERSEGYTIYSATPSLGHPRVELLYSGDYIDVAPYSGALTYSTYSSIVIKYYK